MAAESSPRAVGDDSAATSDARMRLTCSHGGRFVFCGPDAAPRYVGGETRVLVIPRSASFRDLAARASEMAGGAEVSALKHRLADDEEIIVSVTCDEELAHMIHEYDRLHAKRPNAKFRVFVDIAAAPPASGAGAHHHQQPRPVSGLPPLAPTRMRRVQSDHALAASAQRRVHRCPAYPAPMRRVQSAQEIATKASRVQPSPSFHFHQRGHQSRFVCQRQYAPAPAPPPSCVLPHISRRNVTGVSSVNVEAEAKARSRDANKSTVDDNDNRRAVWEFE
ncbi:hypothetical protein QOZ80_3AG0220870 [Eleusine coracana subsp. coracana]|nr:hypothetical protein QOZ80_3AG0220870 [Eleusine coracana subsp. coracana]